MRGSLLGAFARLALFWWIVPLVIWSWGHPERVERAVSRLSWLREVFGFSPIFEGEVTLFNDVMALAALLTGWTFPVLVALALLVGVGIGLAALTVRTSLDKRVARVQPGAPWRKATVTKGPLPLPPYPIAAAPVAPAAADDPTASLYEALVVELLSFAAAHPKAFCSEADMTLAAHMGRLAEKARLLRLPPAERCVLVGHLAGNPEAYRFDKGDGSWARIRPTGANAARILSACPAWFQLPQRERSVLTLAVKYFDAPGTMPRIGSDDTAHEAAMSLILGAQAALVAAWPEPAAPEPAPEPAAAEVAPVLDPTAPAVVSAVPNAPVQAPARGAQKQPPLPAVTPAPPVAPAPGAPAPTVTAPTVTAPPAAAPRAAVEVPAANGSANVPPIQAASVKPATAAAPVPVAQASPKPVAALPVQTAAGSTIPADDLPAIALKVLMDNMYRLPFQAPGIPKGTRAAGFKRGRRVYLLDAQVRARLLVGLSPELAAVFVEEDRPKGQLFTFTKHLCKALQDKGWLVTKIDDMVVSKKSPLWRVRSGTSEFTGVIALDWPEEHAAMLPASDTTYELAVIGPQFAESEFIDSGVMGALFR